ncbi:MAG: hypothetical protein KZQ64_00645 [gamma proteobacterium symbiont of Bathyaustriella thionipta]|nr:hypothetical protein [gamma proteobacterium symbiont of Bathyaustriella thionipta]MCU7966979.1 hypothetical protein [gamma proteobacterium symbiont of Bathyaustriella thionipta]
MKQEYDFSKAERGKFYRPDAQMNLPVYLDDEVKSYLSERADAKGIGLGEMVNDLLKKDIALIEGVK